MSTIKECQITSHSFCTLYIFIDPEYIVKQNGHQTNRVRLRNEHEANITE